MKMDQGIYEIFQNPISVRIASSQHRPWEKKNGDEDNESCDSLSTMSSSFENSTNSIDSSLSSELAEDASSSCSSFGLSSSPSQINNKGPLYELSQLMAQLPIKRGLSKHFQGKSQSFTSLSNVKSLEDLVKKENPYRKRMKPCKSYAGLDGNTTKSYIPRACSKTISKKSSRGSLPSLLKRSGRNNSPRSPFFCKTTFDM